MRRTVHTSGAAIVTEVLGDPADPVVLLIAGAASSMDWWEDGFCARLVAGGRRVVRYDHRDTGGSTSWPAGKPGYTGTDLLADALAVLDAVDAPSAHVVGVSMGGAMAQRLAVEHAGRVATLTLLCTTFGVPGGPDRPDLPPPRPDVAASFENPGPDPDWSDPDAAVTAIVDGERLFHGTLPFDEDRVRGIARRVVSRTADIAATMTNHWILDAGPSARGRLADLTAPTLVLHGTDDPLFPYPHGEALAAEIPGARLVAMPGVGHQMPPPQVWDLVVEAVLRHTDTGEAAV